MVRRTFAAGAALLLSGRALAVVHARRVLDVRMAGARGDGRTLDTAAFNRAMADLERSGGGTLRVPAGRYLCFSIRLRSNLRIVFEPGAVLVAADPALHAGAYDAPEPAEGLYQDFGHSHWRNSLLWGEEVDNLVIEGPGRIEGDGLTRNGPGARWSAGPGERPLSMAAMSAEAIARLEPERAAMNGLGNKALALRGGRGVRVSGLTIARGGHMAILATGTRALVLENLVIDTERDGIDLDGVRDALVRDCRVNTPNDDAIVVKASLALGRPVASENVVIRGCQVSGFDLGTLLDGTFGRSQRLAPDRDRVTGRIKLGTESNGAFRNVLIEDCRFLHCRGLALETVDGAVMENVVARRLVMEGVTSAPVFVRLGRRLRGPAGTAPGAVRGVSIGEITARGIETPLPVILAGLAERAIGSVHLHAIDLTFDGGGEAFTGTVPDRAEAYPEPSMFGVLPAWGLWARHVERLHIEDFVARTLRHDARAPMVLENVADPRLSGVHFDNAGH
ncbi:glycoside hydrolase family 28 protein [Novosphingobium sp. 1949]|uniref:Glycoside hydrolase family 28 protein n=1 Tax=Novosphingobium organovorum TaxID=2930092 RepID=A0ABT0BCX4_9SPHN|nr:glycosyl hydrolase family 28-related protein [Novosphingobium organovorum]MCJ2182920.1 glycoside hydrolase family 28 protein [Novosphingobium organovorum]